MEGIEERKRLDAILVSNDSLEKIEEDIAKLEEESKNLTEWPFM